MKSLIHLLIAALILVQHSIASACSTFAYSVGGQRFVAKSFDYHNGEGRVLVNLRGLDKEAINLEKGVTPVKWRSRYGSVTFNQIAQYFPYGGMNEKGLTAEILWLSESIYPQANQTQPTLNESQWIQYILDTSASTDEAIAAARRVMVRPVMAKVHYFVCDRAQICASFEYLNGELVINRVDKLNQQALENVRYASVSAPMGRLNEALKGIQQVYSAETSGLNIGYQLLERVKQGSFTQWQIVYDVNNLKVSFRVNRGSGQGNSASIAPAVIEMKKLNFSCRGEAKYAELDQSIAGPITTKLKDFGFFANMGLAKKSLPTGLATLAAFYSTKYVSSCKE